MLLCCWNTGRVTSSLFIFNLSQRNTQGDIKKQLTSQLTWFEDNDWPTSQRRCQNIWVPWASVLLWVNCYSLCWREADRKSIAWCHYLELVPRQLWSLSPLEVHQLASNVRHNISMLRLEIHMAAKGKITQKSQHVTNLAGLTCWVERRERHKTSCWCGLILKFLSGAYTRTRQISRLSVSEQVLHDLCHGLIF